MFVAKLELGTKRHSNSSEIPESWDCPMCEFSIYPDLDPGWIRCEVRTHLFLHHRLAPLPLDLAMETGAVWVSRFPEDIVMLVEEKDNG